MRPRPFGEASVFGRSVRRPEILRRTHAAVFSKRKSAESSPTDYTVRRQLLERGSDLVVLSGAIGENTDGNTSHSLRAVEEQWRISEARSARVARWGGCKFRCFQRFWRDGAGVETGHVDRSLIFDDLTVVTR